MLPEATDIYITEDTQALLKIPDTQIKRRALNIPAVSEETQKGAAAALEK